MMPRDTFLLLVYVFIILAPFALISLMLLDDPEIDQHKVLRAICMTIVGVVLFLSAGFSMEVMFR